MQLCSVKNVAKPLTDMVASYKTCHSTNRGTIYPYRSQLFVLYNLRLYRGDEAAPKKKCTASLHVYQWFSQWLEFVRAMSYHDKWQLLHMHTHWPELQFGRFPYLPTHWPLTTDHWPSLILLGPEHDNNLKTYIDRLSMFFPLGPCLGFWFCSSYHSFTQGTIQVIVITQTIL